MDKQSQTQSRRSRHDPHAAPTRAGARELLIASSQYLPAVPLSERVLSSAQAADPTHEVIRLLIKQLVDDVVVPTLAAQTREELFHGLNGRWGKYHTTMSALVTLFMTTPAGVVLMQKAHEDSASMVRDAAKIAGEKAAEEVAFGEATYLSAVRIIERFSGLPIPKNLQEDGSLCEQFNIGSNVHTLGGCMIGAIASGERATNVAIETAFELFRYGAMNAYIAARKALALRQPPEDVCNSALPIDEDDMSLIDE